jgi:hypothetical protein
MKKILLTLGLLGVLTINTYALTSNTCSGNTCYDVNIVKIYVTKLGTVYIGTSGNEGDLLSGGYAGVYTIIRHDTPGRDILYSLALTAYTSSQKITLTVRGNDIEYIYVK